ncbi:MAG: DUF6179 domain-containing protein [Coprococcus sp.]
MDHNGVSIYRKDELLEIVVGLANRFVSGDSTSITYERAEALMDGVLYCLNEYEKSSVNNSCVRKKLAAGEAYELGCQIILNKACQLKEIYNRMTESFDDYGMVCLRDTAITGVAEFLKRYDVRFSPQETLLTLDYPVLMDISGLSGVDAVLEYIRCIEYEQQFLGKFDGRYIRAVLRRYHQDYERLFENICHIITINLLGHIILRKPLNDQGFTEGELQEICRIIMEQTEEDTEKYITGCIQALIEKYYSGNFLLQKYLDGDVHAMTIRIRFNLSIGHPEKVFLL